MTDEQVARRLEEEGLFTANKTSNGVDFRIGLTVTPQEAYSLVSEFEGHFRKLPSGLIEWRIYRAADALKLLQRIQPHIKWKKEVADLLLKLAQLKIDNFGRIRPGLIKEMEALAADIKKAQILGRRLQKQDLLMDIIREGELESSTVLASSEIDLS